MAGETKALVWDKVGERGYETGVSNVALYVYDESTKAYGKGVAWNGVTAINENPSGGDATDLYADNKKYLSLMAAEKFGCTIEAYTYPEEFEACDGSAELATGVKVGQQSRKMFALAYKTLLGDDVNGDSKGYKLHLVYGCKASPSGKNYSSVNESPEAMTMSWEINTTPVDVTGFKATSTIVIDSTKADSTKLTNFEKTLFGDINDAKMPTPAEVQTAFAAG